MRWKKIHSVIERAAEEAQRLIDDKLAGIADQPAQDSLHDIVGVREVQKSVQEYLKHGEPGVGLECLVDMVSETEIVLAENTREALRAVALAMKMDVSI